MARKKTEPCDFCDCGYGDVLRIGSEDSDDLTLELYPGHIISASAIMYNPRTEETYEATVSVPMNYCPVCGRKWGD
jgi:hypothetical protein